MTKAILEYLKKRNTFIVLICMAVAVGVALGFKVSDSESKPQSATANIKKKPLSETGSDMSKVVLEVRDMSCSGCIATIKGSLSGVQGIKDVVVDIGSGKAEVYFDGGELKDVSAVAAAITESGYPARVLKVLSPKDLAKERNLAAAKARYYIASVSGSDIARADFEKELEVTKRRYSKVHGDEIFNSSRGEALMDRLKAQVCSRLVDEYIFMQEVDKSGFEVDKETIEREFQKYLDKNGKNLEDFKIALKEAGYDFEYFKNKFDRKVKLNKYLVERVLADASSEFEKQRAFSSWFNNSKALAQVVYYDKDLQSLIQQRNSGGGCCPSK